MNTIKNKLADRINTFLNPEAIRSNQRLVIFVICLFIASILWFLNALSKNYTTEIAYPVKYVNLPKNKFIINEPPRKLQLRVNAHGFTLLRYKLRLAFSPVVLNISEIMEENKVASGGYYNLQSSLILDKISRQISSDINIMNVRPPTLQLVFDSLESRFVPVGANLDIQYLSRFSQAGYMQIVPAFVEITGPRAVIEQIDTVFTQRRFFKNIKSDIEKETALDIPEKISVDPRKVVVKIQVDEFTEQSFTIPLIIKSLPSDIKVRLFPQTVEVSFSIGLKQFSEITPDIFSLYVDWSDAANGVLTLPVRVDDIPESIKSLKISPSHVEYLIERN
jgi:YbbR domain-containing protein